MSRILFLLLSVACLAGPADAARRRVRAKPAVLPPIIWVQPPQAPPVPIVVVVELAPPPVIVAPAPTTSLPEAVRTLLAAAE